ncbi:MAG: pyrimidine/purine nucleoside phosphorylase [Oceanococcus sp.]
MISHNSYFDDQVQSLGFERNGRKASVGVLAAGEYHFGTAAAERMNIVSGLVSVQLDGESDCRDFPAGTSFEIAADSGFDIKVLGGPAAYLCEYL